MGATNSEGRIAASLGQSGPAKPNFEPATDILNAGVLMAIPALIATGLFKYISKHFSMKEGYYDIHTIFLLLAFMALSRIQSIEKLRYETPGEWGKILGFDRIPEVRCLRKKINEIAVDNKPQQWSSELCNDWLQKIPEDGAVLYVDGHVRVYNGKQTKLPRHYVSRSKLCLRANCDYWVNAMDGQPFFVINQAVDPGLIKTIENEIIPRLIETIPNQPSQEELASSPLLSRFTIIYDREGYSPDFIKRNWEKRIASTTYAKFVKDNWPEDEFKRYEVKGKNGEVTTQKLAERGVYLGKKIWVREVRKLRSNGQQTVIHSTEYLKDICTLAAGMFSRWCQENYFKYMKQNFGIDRLITYSLEETPDTTEVVNPEYRNVDYEVRKTNGLLNRKIKEYGQINYEEVIDSNESENFILKKLMVIDEIEFLKKEVSNLKEVRSKLPKKIEFKDLPEEERFKSLCTQSKHFIDTVKMIAYRAETAMAYTLKEKMSRKEDARSLLQGIYQNEADIAPDYVNKKLYIRIHNMANQSSMKAIYHLCEELNETETLFPGTDLRLVYEVVS